MKHMRTKSALTINHGMSQAHNVVDFLLFRSLNDIWWYIRATRRRDLPMSGGRAVAGAVASFAARALVVRGAYSATASVLGPVSVPTAMLAINATRAVSTWGLDKFMGWFADTPDDPSTLTTY